MRFSCIGFDIRQWPWDGGFNADETGWEQNEERYCEIVEKFDLKENEYQLLQINTPDLLLDISKYLKEKIDCNLVAIEFPYDLVKLNDTRYGYDTSSQIIELSEFICRGFDVCDFNGLFSVFYHPQLKLKRGTTSLIAKSGLLEALETMQFANFIDLDHSPFVVAQVYSLK